MRILTGLLILFVLSSCATGANFKSVRQGMDREEIDSIMGGPDDIRKNSDFESFKYVDRKVNDFSWDEADYFIIFDKSGKVVDYGRENYRDNSSYQNRALANTLNNLGNAYQTPTYQPVAPVYQQSAPTQVYCTTKNLFGTLYTDCSGQ